jgi:hypothetical protein
MRSISAQTSSRLAASFSKRPGPWFQSNEHLSDKARTRAEVEWLFSGDAYPGSQIVFTDPNGAAFAFGAELPANIFDT